MEAEKSKIDSWEVVSVKVLWQKNFKIKFQIKKCNFFKNFHTWRYEVSWGDSLKNTVQRQFWTKQESSKGGSSTDLRKKLIICHIESQLSWDTV